MTEKIGNVTLDYEFYPGQDFYCDGAIEDELLSIVKENKEEEFPQIIREKEAGRCFITFPTCVKISWNGCPSIKI